MPKTMTRFSTCLWFDSDAEEAIRFYATVFDDARVESISYYGDAGHDVHRREKGSVMTVTCSIDGQGIMGLNGGPVFELSPAISFYVSCKSEADVEALYAKLSEDGTDLMPLGKYPFSEKYAWVKDKFGASWQLNCTGESKQLVSPCLMFTDAQQGRAEEAINFYASVFEDSRIESIVKYEAGESLPGKVKHSRFWLNGQRFVAMDSPIEHGFSFSPSTSFIIKCRNQEEIDNFWEELTADGGAPSQCGWLTDKFGVSWQVVPTVLQEMTTNTDEARKDRVLGAIMKMSKFDISQLEEAYRQSD